MKGDALYKFARSSALAAVCVDDLDADTRKLDYACLSCGNKLIPVMGDENEWHFRHFTKTTCSGETYLHKLGKEIFYQTYLDCLIKNKPFEVEFPVIAICRTCQIIGHDSSKSCHFNKFDNWNLIGKFIEINKPEEIRDGQFVPDILLRDKAGDNIYIEIVVSHKSTDKKIQSGSKIIEINLSDESDLAVISNCFLKSSPKISFINFPESKKDNKESPNRCYFDFFIVANNGRCYILNQRLGFVINDREDGEYFYYQYMPRTDRYAYFVELEKAFQKFPERVKNCFLCRYHGQNERKESNVKPVFCRFLKKSFSQHEAVSCKFYKPDYEVFPSQNIKDLEANFDFEK